MLLRKTQSLTSAVVSLAIIIATFDSYTIHHKHRLGKACMLAKL